jgi:hypothetical protein
MKDIEEKIKDILTEVRKINPAIGEYVSHQKESDNYFISLNPGSVSISKASIKQFPDIDKELYTKIAGTFSNPRKCC